MLKVGVVGCGGMGVWHLKKYSELPKDGEKGALLVRILEAIYLSAQKGKEVTLK